MVSWRSKVYRAHRIYKISSCDRFRVRQNLELSLGCQPLILESSEASDSESVVRPHAPATLEIACRQRSHDVVNSGHDSRRDIDIELNDESRCRQR
jgi:hypothetical protein